MKNRKKAADPEGTTIDHLHQRAANMLAQGADEAFIISTLVKTGIEQYYAETILENVKNDKYDKKQFWKHLFAGTFFILAGLCMTLLGRWGMVYVIYWGIVVYGVVLVSKAIILFRK